MVTSDRLAKALDAVAASGLDAMLIGPSADLLYLTGYAPMPLERLILAVVRSDGQAHLIVPELEAPGAEASALDSIELHRWHDSTDPYVLVRRLLKDAPRLAVGERLWASHVLALQREMPAARMVPATELMAGLRSIKDDAELDRLGRAAEAADETFEVIVGQPFAGRTERELAEDLARILLEQGHDRTEFTIVGSGPNSASPHHEPTSRPIAPGDAVVMDFGGEIDSYFSDITRTVAVKEEPAGYREIYEVVVASQEAAFRAVTPGTPAMEVDRAARSVITESGFGDGFVHRTGHGIGLELHEAPYIVEGNQTPLEPRMVFSIEPGVYLSGRLGVRIEDIVVVTDEGARRLNHADRSLRLVN
jgi:Xaa-Pro aminopeptidase